MPTKHSAKKALRQAQKRTLINQAAKANIKYLEKKLVKAIMAKDTTGLKSNASSLVQAWDKAAKNNLIRLCFLAVFYLSALVTHR